MLTTKNYHPNQPLIVSPTVASPFSLRSFLFLPLSSHRFPNSRPTRSPALASIDTARSSTSRSADGRSLSRLVRAIRAEGESGSDLSAGCGWGFWKGEGGEGDRMGGKEGVGSPAASAAAVARS